MEDGVGTEIGVHVHQLVVEEANQEFDLAPTLPLIMEVQNVLVLPTKAELVELPYVPVRKLSNKKWV